MDPSWVHTHNTWFFLARLFRVTGRSRYPATRGQSRVAASCCGSGHSWKGHIFLCSSEDEAATTIALEDSLARYVPLSTSTGFWVPTLTTRTHSNEMRHLLCQLDRTEESQGTLNSATFEYASQLPSKKP